MTATIGEKIALNMGICGFLFLVTSVVLLVFLELIGVDTGLCMRDKPRPERECLDKVAYEVRLIYRDDKNPNKEKLLNLIRQLHDEEDKVTQPKLP